MSAPDRSRKLLRRMALLCTVLVLVITSLSAYIRLSRAGLCFNDIHEDFAETGCNRPHFRFDAFRKLTARRLQALIN